MKVTPKQPYSRTQVGGDHYKNMPIQPTEFCHRNGLGACETLAIRYIVRHKNKAGRQDIEKAIHCLQLLLEWGYPEAEEEASPCSPDPADTGSTFQQFATLINIVMTEINKLTRQGVQPLRIRLCPYWMVVFNAGPNGEVADDTTCMQNTLCGLPVLHWRHYDDSVHLHDITVVHPGSAKWE